MFFKGLFISITSFSVIVGVSSLVGTLDFRFSRLVWPLFPCAGILLLFAALWVSTLFLSVLLCSAALTFFLAACRLKPSFGRRSNCRSCKSKGHPRC